MTKIVVEPLGWLPRLADMQMTPIMYALSGTLKESPQKTHRWNNCRRLPQVVADALDSSKFLQFSGIPGAIERGIALFHLKLFGGWEDYVVLEPEEEGIVWYIGWDWGDGAGMSLLQVDEGRARVTIGPGNISFFCIGAKDGRQIFLKYVGKGKIGHGGEWADAPLH